MMKSRAKVLTEVPKRCVIYSRVSTEKQAEHNISIPDQIARAHLYADTQGWEVIGEYVDAGASGRDETKRPQFREMISEALSDSHPFDIILVHSFSRFYRDQARSELTRRDLKRKRVQVRSLTQEIDDDEGGGTFALSIMGLIDEYQSRENSKHVRRALEANARDGFQNGGTTPYGYRLDMVEMRGQRPKHKLAIEDREAAVVREVYQRHLDGQGSPTIARIFNEQGRRTRKGHKWTTSALYAIVTSETYVGRNFFKGRDPLTKEINPREAWVEIPCPAIVSEEMFYAVQEQLRMRQPKITAPQITSSPVLLGGIACCGSCGRHLQLATGTSRTGAVHRYYKCAGKIGNGACAGGKAISMAEADLDDIVLESLTEQLMVPERVGSIVQGVFERRSKEHDMAIGRLKELKSLLAKTKREEQNLWDVAASTGLNQLPGFKEKMSDLARDRESLARNISAHEATLRNAVEPLTHEEAVEAAAKMRGLAANADIDIRRRYVRAFVSKVVVTDATVHILGPDLTIAKAACGLDLTYEPQVRGFDAAWLPE